VTAPGLRQSRSLPDASALGEDGERIYERLDAISEYICGRL